MAIVCMMLKCILEEVQAIEEVFGLANLNLGFGLHFGNWTPQFHGFIRGSTGIALVAPRTIGFTDGARTFHVPIGQKSPSTLSIQFEILLGGFPFKQPGLFQCDKVLLNDSFVFRVARTVEEGATEFNASGVRVGGPSATKVVQCLGVDSVKSIDDLLRVDTLLLRGHGDRRTVFIGPRNHQNPVAESAFKPKLNIGGEVTSSHVAQMEGAVRIGPSDTNQHVFARHFNPPENGELHPLLEVHPPRVQLRCCWLKEASF